MVSDSTFLYIVHTVSISANKNIIVLFHHCFLIRALDSSSHHFCYHSIAANVKQVLMIAISTIIFSTPIAMMNGFGIIVVLIGSARYSYVSVLEKQALQKMNKESSNPDEETKHLEERKADLEDPNSEANQESVELLQTNTSPDFRKR